MKGSELCLVVSLCEKTQMWVGFRHLSRASRMVVSLVAAALFVNLSPEELKHHFWTLDLPSAFVHLRSATAKPAASSSRQPR
jgi:hypothetical protein